MNELEFSVKRSPSDLGKSLFAGPGFSFEFQTASSEQAIELLRHIQAAFAAGQRNVLDHVAEMLKNGKP